MPAQPGDVWVWATVGVVAFFAVRSTVTQLRYLQAPRSVERRARDDAAQTRAPGPNVENDLQLSTLYTLATGPSGGIRDSAVALICERAASGRAFALTLEQVASPDYDTRSEALVALRFLSASAAVWKITTFATFRALIKALNHTLDDPDRFTRPLGRQATERIALMILLRLMSLDVTLAVRSGVITGWLTHYPFDSDTSKKQAAIQSLRVFTAGDDLLSHIFNGLAQEPDGARQLREAGLLPPEWERAEPDDGQSLRIIRHVRSRNDWSTDDGDSSSDDSSAAPTTDGEPQAHDNFRRRRPGNAAESSIRRRRREVMVLSDGAQPWNSGDVIHATETGGTPVGDDDDHIERGLLSLMDQVQHGEQAGSWRVDDRSRRSAPRRSDSLLHES